jgi:hypothetical protein
MFWDSLVEVQCEVALSGALVQEFFRDVHKLMFDPRSWSALHRKHHTQELASIAFALSSVAACAVELSLNCEGYPCKLWLLLLSDQQTADTIHHDPPCLKDVFSSKFLKQFNSSAKLMGSDCRMKAGAILAQASRQRS